MYVFMLFDYSELSSVHSIDISSLYQSHEISLSQMSKRRKNVLNSSSEDEIESDGDANKRVKPSRTDSSDSSSEGSDEEWTMGEGGVGKQKRHAAESADNEEGKGRPSSPSQGESWESGEDKSVDTNGDESESESGEASDSASDSQDESTSGGDEFNDGLNSDLTAGPEDRDKLHRMTEAEREQEIYRRLEHRETLMERKRIYKQMQKERREKERRERPEKIRKKSSKKKRGNDTDEREMDLFNDISRRSERKRKPTDVKRSEAMDQLKQNRMLRREKQENDVKSDKLDPKTKLETKKKQQLTVSRLSYKYIRSTSLILWCDAGFIGRFKVCSDQVVKAGLRWTRMRRE